MYKQQKHKEPGGEWLCWLGGLGNGELHSGARMVMGQTTLLGTIPHSSPYNMGKGRSSLSAQTGLPGT